MFLFPRPTGRPRTTTEQKSKRRTYYIEFLLLHQPELDLHPSQKARHLENAVMNSLARSAMLADDIRPEHCHQHHLQNKLTSQTSTIRKPKHPPRFPYTKNTLSKTTSPKIQKVNTPTARDKRKVLLCCDGVPNLVLFLHSPADSSFILPNPK